jgi:hypothetical protein
MKGMRAAAGLVAALLLSSIGFALLGSLPLPGVALIVAGGGGALWQAWRVFSAQRERERYDLTRLWERPPPADDEDAGAADPTEVEDDGTLYCHSCGHAVPAAFHKCPECGRPLT